MSQLDHPFFSFRQFSSCESSRNCRWSSPLFDAHMYYNMLASSLLPFPPSLAMCSKHRRQLKVPTWREATWRNFIRIARLTARNSGLAWLRSKNIFPSRWEMMWEKPTTVKPSLKNPFTLSFFLFPGVAWVCRWTKEFREMVWSAVGIQLEGGWVSVTT